MKKLNTFLLGALLLTSFMASAQTFPLLGNVYDTDCLDEASSTYYWTKNSSGDVIRYQKLKGNDFRALKSTVKKFSVEGNRVAIESVVDGDKTVLTEIFELKPEKKGFDTLYVAVGAEELVKNGVLVSDQTRALAFQHLCEPSSKKATLMRSNFQQSSPAAQAKQKPEAKDRQDVKAKDVAATTDKAQPGNCPMGLKDLWMGSVAGELVNKNPNSPSQIKEIAKAWLQKDKSSYIKLVDTYKCDIFEVGEMGYVSFQNSNIEILMVAWGGKQTMKNPKTCYSVGLIDKVTNKREMTQAKLVFDKSLPIPEAVNECR